MTLQTTGIIKFSEIQTEFGGSNPISLSEYYGVDTVPASGIIAMSDFYGTSSSDVTATFSFSPATLGPETGSASGAIGGINTTISITVDDFTIDGAVTVKLNGVLKTFGVAFNAVDGDVIRIDYTQQGDPPDSSPNGSVTVVNNSDGGATLAILSLTTFSAL